MAFVSQMDWERFRVGSLSSDRSLVNQSSLQRIQKVILDHNRQLVGPQNCSVDFQAVVPSTSGRVR